MNVSLPLIPRPRMLDVESLAHFDQLVAAGAESMAGWHLQSLDLSHRTRQLRRLDPDGAMFLGCIFADGMEGDLRARGALIFPRIPDAPFNPYRGSLYTGPELFENLERAEYEATPDALIYAWSSRAGTGRTVAKTLATALHDHAIAAGLEEALVSGAFAGKSVVGVMGGHAAVRGSTTYDGAARLGRLLAQAGFGVATGGGPGAMEAANLGAYLSEADDGVFAEVLRGLALVPSFRPSITEWARAAAAVVAAYPHGTPNLGIPTWFYGHEPPNLFATHIAKYFANATREAVLLEKCTGGIVFLPGAAGTVQEIFQDACENYYGVPEVMTPMILVDRTYWSEELPAWQLLRALAKGRRMADHVHLVETVDDALTILGTRTGATDLGFPDREGIAPRRPQGSRSKL